MNQKYKKVLIVIIIFILVTTVTYAFSAYKTEAPIIKKGFAIEVKNEIKKVEEEKVNVANIEKYKIVDRSVVVPIDTLNKKKVVLLTIDDGPSARTLQIIEVLKKHNAKAIFFINGMHDKNYKGIIEKINTEGYEVGNHTWSHLNLKKEKI